MKGLVSSRWIPLFGSVWPTVVNRVSERARPAVAETPLAQRLNLADSKGGRPGGER